MNGARHESGVGMMRLTLREDNEMEFLEQAAQEVRRLAARRLAGAAWRRGHCSARRPPSRYW